MDKRDLMENLVEMASMGGRENRDSRVRLGFRDSEVHLVNKVYRAGQDQKDQRVPPEK